MKITRKNNTRNTLNPFHINYIQNSSYAINQPIIYSVWTELLELIKKIKEVKKIEIDLLTVLKPMLTQSRYPLARTKENDTLLPLLILQEALSNSQTAGEGLYSFLKKCFQNKRKVNLGAQVKLALCRNIYEYLQENEQPAPFWFQSFIEQSNIIKKQALEATKDPSLKAFTTIYSSICSLLGTIGFMILCLAALSTLSDDPRTKPPHSLVVIAAIVTPVAFLGVCGMVFSNQLLSWWHKDKRLNELPSPSGESPPNLEDLAESFMKMLNTNPQAFNIKNIGFFSRNRSQSAVELFYNGSIPLTIVAKDVNSAKL